MTHNSVVVTTDPQWADIFGYDEPYPEQADGIEAAIEAADGGGFLALEGACGTGKTQLALTAGIDRVRDPDSAFERVFVLTSVKQQLRQFENDLERINRTLPEGEDPVSGLTLVGKADVCPYARENRGGIDKQTVYERCEGLRERTRNLTGEGGTTTAAALASEARSQQVGLTDTKSDGGATEYLTVDGEPTPYRPGNYYHAFDPVTTATFTGALVDDKTFLVCDEAHMLEPRVRDLVSDRLADSRLKDAVNELTRVVQALSFNTDAQIDTDAPGSADTEEQRAAVMRGELEDSEVTREEITDVRALYADLRAEIDRRVTARLDRTRPDWRAAMTTLDDDEIPLRDPEKPETDEITAWAMDAGHGDRVWARAPAVGAAVERALDAITDDDTRRAASGVGRVINAWYTEGHTDFFRAIRLERTYDETAPDDSWQRAYNASLALYNCLPSEPIGEQLAAFGGGVLMSATLEPMDVFKEVTGLDHLLNQGRPVLERTHGLTFPPANRASFAVDAPKFTYENRGDPDEKTETRLVYLDTVSTVAAREGNVLVGMPNYAEADWMAAALDERLEKPVLLDESSDDHATEALKDDFFAGEAKVLVTSLRGTLTEGVDYAGDRLKATVICGVPLINTNTPRTQAVVTAYDRRFDSGFETALTVPAVRKARQAIGRVIRGQDECGVRVLVDARYARRSWNDVRGYFPAHEREEFQPVTPDMLEFALDQFDAGG